MNSRYPLTRFEIYKKHEDAIQGFKEARVSFQSTFDMKFYISNLVMEDKYIRCYFIALEETKIRGFQIDKAVFHYEPTKKELYLVKSHINPNTTVEKPITIEMLP